MEKRASQLKIYINTVDVGSNNIDTIVNRRHICNAYNSFLCEGYRN